MKFKKDTILFCLLSIIMIFFFIFLFNSDFLFCDLTDSDFISLIKRMSIKNHNDPSLYTQALSEASTDEARIKVMLTDKFYECVYKNKNVIYTKSDLNTLCGHLIYFKP